MNLKIPLFIFLTTVAGLIGYYVYNEGKDQNIPSSTPPIVSRETVSSETVGQIKEEQKIVHEKSIPIPDLESPVIISGTFSEGQKEQITIKIKDLTALLKQDANLFNEWMALGLLRKSIEDYEGAREIWEYAGTIRPQNSISFINLGTLYGYYIQNAILAEKNYLKALENDSKYPYYYVQISDFYLEVLKDKRKAEEVLERGLKEVPEDETLKVALENLTTNN